MLSFIVALHLLGIFLLLPIFSAYAIQYPGATLPLVGVALGIYALVQSLLQIPSGWASDRFSRKLLLLVGLFLFSLGSFVCGMAEDITQLILARALQGSGAVSSVAMAALGDLTRPQVRAQAFTLVGMAVGAAFTMGLPGGPFLAAQLGFPGLFYLLAALSFFAFLITVLFFPEIHAPSLKRDKLRFRALMGHAEIRRLYLAAFILSFTLNLFFFVYPLSWTDLGLSRPQIWKVYLVTLLPSLLLVFPSVRYAERQGRLRLSAWGGWIFMVVSFLIPLAGRVRRWSLYMTGGSFFLGYTLFQALLPAFLTQRVPSESRGATTGFYNLAGFLGASFGGMVAGVLYHSGQTFPLIAGLLFFIIWPFIGLPNPPDSGAMH